MTEDKWTVDSASKLAHALGRVETAYANLADTLNEIVDDHGVPKDEVAALLGYQPSSAGNLLDGYVSPGLPKIVNARRRVSRWINAHSSNDSDRMRAAAMAAAEAVIDDYTS